MRSSRRDPVFRVTAPGSARAYVHARGRSHLARYIPDAEPPARWLARWSTEAGAASRAGRLFAELRGRGLSYEVCDYCAGAFDVKEDLVEAGEALAGEYMDHPSLAAHVGEGFAVWVL